MLLFYPKPYSQETLLSFIYRVAKEHEMANLDWIFDLIEKECSIKLTPERVNWLNGVELETISKFLGVQSEEAKKLTVYKYFQMWNIEIKNESKNILFLYKKTRYCPMCLKERVYQRTSWINCHSTVCLKHGLLLMDSCHNCDNIPNTKSIILDECLKCNTKLSSSTKKINIPSYFSEYQFILDNILEKNKLFLSNTWIDAPSTFINTLDFLALWVVKTIPAEDLTIPITDLKFGGSILERNHLKNYRSIQQTVCLYSYVFELIMNWPFSFNVFLKEAEKHNLTTFYSLLRHGIPKLINTSLWNISKAFTNYIAKEKLKLMGEDFFRSDELKYIYPKFNGNIVNSDQVRHFKFHYLKTEVNIINKLDLDNFMETYRESYSKEEFQEVWGTSPKATNVLLNSDLFENAFCYQSGSIFKWLVPILSVQKTANQIIELSIQDISNPIMFNHAIEWVGPDKAHLLFKSILNGEIRIKYINGKLSDMLLCKTDVYYQVKDEIINSCDISSLISIRDLTFILGVKRSDVQYWIDTGRFGVLKKTGSEIPIQNFLLFHGKFITTFELALELNIQIKQVLKKHSLGKFISVSGPHVNDGKRLLFKRDAYEKVY